jgi:tetratricopeptide (TPR) repeat protein
LMMYGLSRIWTQLAAACVVGNLAGVAHGDEASQKSEDNLVRITRTVTLPEFGYATVSHRVEFHGELESQFRHYIAKVPQEAQMQMLNAMATRGSPSGKVLRAKLFDPTDLKAPYSLFVEFDQFSEAQTDLVRGVVRIPDGLPFWLLPQPLLPASIAGMAVTAIPELSQPNGGPPIGGKPVTTDIDFVPSVAELRYEIHIPAGFNVRSLPADATDSFGPAQLSKHYAQTGDGLIEVLIRFDTVRGHYSAAEAEEVRKQIAAFVGKGSLNVDFDLTAFELNMTGEHAKALAAYEQRIARQPKLAVEHVRLAEALIYLGLLDRAQSEDLLATRLDPTFAPGWHILAITREDDALGRPFEPGFDREGALSALQTVKKLAPNYLRGRYDLAALLEHDSDGVRYSYRAPLSEAAAELLEVRKIPGFADGWNDELLLLLGLTGQFEEIRKLIPEMQPTETRLQWLLAAAFFSGGEKAAREAATALSLDRSATQHAFYGAAGALESAREYDMAKRLMAISSVEPSMATYRADHLKILNRIKRHEDEQLSLENPADAARQMMVSLMRPAAGGPRFGEILSRTAFQAFSRDPQSFAAMSALSRGELSSFTQQGYPVDEAIDMYLSNEDVTVEGNPQNGYRVRRRNGGDQGEGLFVVEGGDAKLLATSETSYLIGADALARADAGLDEEARELLNSARSYSRATATEDPLTAPIFPRLWPSPDDGDGQTMRYAAAVLSAPLGDPIAVSILTKVRETAGTDAQRLDCDRALASAYFAQRDWRRLAEVAARLWTAFPDSKVAFQYITTAYRGTREWGLAESATADWVTRHKDDVEAVLARAQALQGQEKYHDARALLEPLIFAGTANTAVLNQFAWISVSANEVDEPAVDAAREASNRAFRQKVPAFGVSQTLACVYAMSGRPKEARDVLFKAMDAAGMTTPNSSAWFAQALIAEAYGDSKSARLYLSRVKHETARDDDPGSSFNLARRRLEWPRYRDPEEKRSSGK